MADLLLRKTRRLGGVVLVAAAGFIVATAVAAEVVTEEIAWASMGMGLLGGLALFLFGLEQLADSLQAAAGDQVKKLLARLTGTRITAALSGAVVTAVIQSSSVTTVLVVGFIAAGLMSLSQSIGVILGANIGTTVTAQVVAFKITEAALPLIAVGFTMVFFSKRDALKQLGGAAMGLGLIFFGMGIMSDAMEPLRSHGLFVELMTVMEQPLLGLLVAAGFTALVQSSSATTSLVVVLASQGFVPLEAGIAMALGANIGTCVTALLAAIGKRREALRAALVHVLFNVVGVLLWLGFIAELADLAIRLSPTYQELSGVERLAAETPRQIANANTLFNLANTIIFLPFAGSMARFVTRLVPEAAVAAAPIRPKYLDAELIVTPALALDRVQLELGRVGEFVEEMLSRIRPAFLNTDRAALAETAERDDQVDILYAAIVGYLGQIRQQSLSEAESENFVRLMSATESLENIGDVIAESLVPLGYDALDAGVEMSPAMRQALTDLHATVSRAVEAAVRSVRNDDAEAARAVLRLKKEVNRRIREVLQHQAERLAVGGAHRLAIFRAEMRAADDLKRIYTLAKRIARAVLPKSVAVAA